MSKQLVSIPQRTKALRNLDYLIHQTVFGRYIVHIPFVPANVKHTNYFTDEALREYNRTYSRGLGGKSVPHYSLDEKDAWSVVEYLKRAYEFQCGTKTTREYYASFEEKGSQEFKYIFGSTLPIVISLAALRLYNPDWLNIYHDVEGQYAMSKV